MTGDARPSTDTGDRRGAPPTSTIIARCSAISDVADRTAVARHLDTLLDGNRRFVAATPAPRELAAERAAGLAGQSPCAAVIACSDSRVAIRDTFDAPLGTIFTVRTAGAALDVAATASLEYAVTVLATRLVLVLGHDGCGAVTAALGRDLPPGNLGALAARLRETIVGARDLDHAIDLNAVRTAAALRRSGTLGEAYAAGRIAVVPLRYRLADGSVDVLDPAAVPS